MRGVLGDFLVLPRHQRIEPVEKAEAPRAVRLLQRELRQVRRHAAVPHRHVRHRAVRKRQRDRRRIHDVARRMMPVAARRIHPHRRCRVQVQHRVHHVTPLRQHVAAALNGVVGPEIRRPVIINHLRHRQRGLRQKRLRRDHGREKPQLKSRRRRDPRPLHRRHDAVAIGQRDGERLLEEKVLPGRRRRLGQRRMRVVLCADPDRLDPRVRPDPRHVTRGITGAVLVLEFFRAPRGEIGHRDQLHAGISRKKPGVLGAITAAADDGRANDPGRIHGVAPSKGRGPDVNKLFGRSWCPAEARRRRVRRLGLS